MNSQFSGLSYTQIMDISGQLDTKSTSMKDLLENVKTLLQRVGTDGTWSGTAAQATLDEFNTLIAKFEEFSSAVKACSTHLKGVVERFKAVDAAIQGNK